MLLALANGSMPASLAAALISSTRLENLLSNSKLKVELEKNNKDGISIFVVLVLKNLFFLFQPCRLCDEKYFQNKA